MEKQDEGQRRVRCDALISHTFLKRHRPNRDVGDTARTLACAILDTDSLFQSDGAFCIFPVMRARVPLLILLSATLACSGARRTRGGGGGGGGASGDGGGEGEGESPGEGESERPVEGEGEHSGGGEGEGDPPGEGEGEGEGDPPGEGEGEGEGGDPEGCGGACSEQEVCFEGDCLEPCPDERVRCPGRNVCRDLLSNPFYCGGCDTVCGPGEQCHDGVCGVQCRQGETYCDRCTDTGADAENCGDCGIACGPDGECHDGECREECPERWDRCRGECVDTRSDDDHCGFCDVECSQEALCADGVCTCVVPGLSPCGPRCFDLANDPRNCGFCERSCEDPQECSDGGCQDPCEEGLGNCDRDHETGCETDLMRSSEHCGRCGLGCAEDEGCYEGQCEERRGVTYSEQFPPGPVALGSPQCRAWQAFVLELRDGDFNRVTIRGSNDEDGQICEGAAANQLCQALAASRAVTVQCDGRAWATGDCGDGMEINADDGVCRCEEPRWTVRPCIGNNNWGGVNTQSCGAPAQTLEVVCE
jgi:hypothetical protein